MTSPVLIAILAGVAVFFVVKGLAGQRGADLLAELDEGRLLGAPGAGAPLLVRLVGSVALRFEGESRIFRRVVSAGAIRQSRNERLLARAGRPWGITGADLDAFTIAGAITGAAAGVFLAELLALPWILGLVVGLVVGLYPRVVVQRMGDERARKIRRALPSTLDLLVLAAEAGATEIAGLRMVAERTTGPLAEAIGRAVREVEEVSADPERAFAVLAEECGVDEVTEFVSALSVATSAGNMSYHEALAGQADRLRIALTQEVEKDVHALATKLAAPMTLFFLPSIFLVMVGPAMYQMLKVL